METLQSNLWLGRFRIGVKRARQTRAASMHECKEFHLLHQHLRGGGRLQLLGQVVPAVAVGLEVHLQRQMTR